MNKERRLKIVPDPKVEKHRTHEEWVDSLRVRQGFGRLAVATMVAAYLDKDFGWIEEFFANSGELIPSALTGQEFFDAQWPVFETLMMGDMPTDEQLETADKAGRSK